MRSHGLYPWSVLSASRMRRGQAITAGRREGKRVKQPRKMKPRAENEVEKGNWDRDRDRDWEAGRKEQEGQRVREEIVHIPGSCYWLGGCWEALGACAVLCGAVVLCCRCTRATFDALANSSLQGSSAVIHATPNHAPASLTVIPLTTRYVPSR